MRNMGKWIDALNSALAGFARPDRTLDLAISAPDATPAELGQAVRVIFGETTPGLRAPDIQDVAARVGAQAHAAADALREGLPHVLFQFERRVVETLKGRPDAQKAAGLVLACEFGTLGRSEAGH